MANKNLFSKSSTASVVARTPVADTVNAAGGKSYSYSPKHALAQVAATNTFNSTYYVSAEDNLKIAKDAAMALVGVDNEFIANVAIYSRSRSYMKDMPAFLTCVLADADPKLFRKVFRRVIDNGKMLRNVLQMARSGVLGKVRNVGSGSYRHAIQEWFENRNGWVLFKASVGNEPSMRDILRMSHVRPNSPEQAALFAYFLGAENKDGVLRVQGPKTKGGDTVWREHSFMSLPEIVQQYENYKRTKEGKVPNVDFRFLDSLGLDKAGWMEVARNGGWMFTRMNLNTFARHGVFESKEMVDLIAAKLRDKDQIAKARAFPYQLLMAWKAAGENVPAKVGDALHDAMEMSIDNVPEIPGKVYVMVDVSGSMGSPITGSRFGGHTTQVRCVDVAALFACALFRKNKNKELGNETVLMPFDTSVHSCNLNARDTVMTNAQILARFGGGGTNCSLPLAQLNRQNAKGDAVIYVSDNESWVDRQYGRSTGTMTEWIKFRDRNKKAKLICIDLQASGSSQVKERKDILQVGGFSDAVFDVVSAFIRTREDDPDFWVREIEKVSLADASDAVPETEEVDAVFEEGVE